MTRRVGAMGSMIVAVDPEVLAAWVSHSCQVQGVPVFVSDSSVLYRVRALVRVDGSILPHRHDGVVQGRTENGVLTLQVQFCPSVAQLSTMADELAKSG